MFLKRLLALNSGPTLDLELVPEFNNDGTPKPLVLVGTNGSGKTNILSLIADALVELAATHFVDASHMTRDAGRAFFRVVGSMTIRAGTKFELAALLFDHHGESLAYRTKGGDLSAAEVADRMQPFLGLGSWPTEGNQKQVAGSAAKVESIFRRGCYVYFPSSRAELPFWANSLREGDDVPEFVDRYRDRLRKPIVAASSIEALKPWLVDVILDQAIDSGSITRDPQRLVQLLNGAIQNSPALDNVNAVLSSILQRPEARIVRGGRGHLNRKIQVFDGLEPYIPSLNSLSAGQATLFAMFGSILRYADTGLSAALSTEMEGIVIIDEADAHLHSDLQYDVLPLLIKLFPKIQFILSAHSPLLPLGLEKHLGEDAFTMLELPHGTQISAERFSEFAKSLLYFQDTQSYEASVRERVASSSRPLVLCEGETDPIYLRKAAELLGFKMLLDSVDFDWVGIATQGGAQDGGKDRLAQAAKLLRNNPVLVHSPTVLLFDCDATQPEVSEGMLHIRTLPRREDNSICRSGIENLLPPEIFDRKFYRTVEKVSADIVTVKKLQKQELCSFVCEERAVADDFTGFRSSLQMLSEIFGLADQQERV